MKIDFKKLVGTQDLIVDWDAYKRWYEMDKTHAFLIPKGDKVVQLADDKPIVVDGLELFFISVYGENYSDAPIQCRVPAQFIGIKISNLSQVIERNINSLTSD